MLQKEFEERIGGSVTPEFYKMVERIYMACELDKDEFCELWKKQDLMPILTSVVAEKEKLEMAYSNSIKQYNDYDKYIEVEKLKLAKFLLAKAEKYEDRDLRRKAVDLIGERAVVIAKFEDDMEIWDEDREYILNNL